MDAEVVFVVRRGGTQLWQLKAGVVLDDFLATHPEYLIVEGPLPDQAQREAWGYDGVCEATDGCTVQPSGHCPHGHPSWLLVYGLI